MKLGLAFAALGVLATASAYAAGNLESGLKPGEPTGVFDVVDVTGPNRGKQLCYI